MLHTYMAHYESDGNQRKVIGLIDITKARLMAALNAFDGDVKLM